MQHETTLLFSCARCMIFIHDLSILLCKQKKLQLTINSYTFLLMLEDRGKN